MKTRADGAEEMRRLRAMLTEQQAQIRTLTTTLSTGLFVTSIASHEYCLTYSVRDILLLVLRYFAYYCCDVMRAQNMV